MFTNIQYGSTTVTNTMDVCRVMEDCAWVIDGADPLFPMHLTDAASDGEWFVKELNLYLKKNLHLPFQSISDIMYRGLQLIHQEYLKYPQADEVFDLEMPSACCAIVRIRHERMDYFILGNCELVITDHNGEIKRITDLRLQELDARLLEISQELRQKQRMPLFQARNFMDHLMVENRLRRNIEGGYYVLGEDQNVVKQALSGSISLHDIRSISLVCHGFSQYFHTPKVRKYLETYVKEKRTADFVAYYDGLLAKKHAGSHLAQYMQEQLAKPSTVVFFDVHETSKIEEGKKR